MVLRKVPSLIKTTIPIFKLDFLHIMMDTRITIMVKEYIITALGQTLITIIQLQENIITIIVSMVGYIMTMMERDGILLAIIMESP